MAAFEPLLPAWAHTRAMLKSGGMHAELYGSSPTMPKTRLVCRCAVHESLVKRMLQYFVGGYVCRCDMACMSTVRERHCPG